MNMKRSDLVTIIAVITILLLLGLIAMKKMQRSRERSLRISCVSNLHHVNLSFRIWANDHDNLYPTQLADEKGGAKQSIERGDLFRVFLVLSNELFLPKTVTCPADTRIAATNWNAFGNTNTSYFVGPDAVDTKPEMILAGDRNLALNGVMLTGIVAMGTNLPVTWTREIHGGAGNFAPTGGGTLRVTTEQFRQQLMKSGDATNLLVFPQ